MCCSSLAPLRTLTAMAPSTKDRSSPIVTIQSLNSHFNIIIQYKLNLNSDKSSGVNSKQSTKT